MKKYVLLIILVLLITGCKENTFSKELFLEKATNNAYIIQNNKRGYENYDYILDIYYAISVDNSYDIQFLILKDENYAKRFYETNKQELMALVDNNTYVKNYNETSYNVYHIENNSKYMIVIRYKNNIIYIDAPIDNINEIEEFLNEMDLEI